MEGDTLMRCQFVKVLLPRIFAASVAVAWIAAASGARAQDCELMLGPARTDCFAGRARILGQQSDIAAGSARLRTSAERLRAVTGGSYVPKRYRAKSKRKARLD
jgi:hypothetical protein